YRIDFFLYLVFGYLRYLAKRKRSRNRDSQNRSRVGIQLLNSWLVGSFRQIGNARLNLVLYFLCRDVNVFFQYELDKYLRDAFDRSGTQFVDTAYGIHGFLDLIGDLGLHFLRRSTEV